MKILEIPRRGKFYQGPGWKHTSDIFHLLSTQSFIIRSSPHTGGGGTPGAYKKNKQTNDRVSRCIHDDSQIYWCFLIFDHKKSLVVTRVYFEHDPGSVRHFDFSSSLMAICVARLKICWVCRFYFSGLVCLVLSLDECLIKINYGQFFLTPGSFFASCGIVFDWYAILRSCLQLCTI